MNQEDYTKLEEKHKTANQELEGKSEKLAKCQETKDPNEQDLDL